MPEIRKAYAMSDVKISFVSLVDKAANKRQFLVTKADDGSASFTSIGRIVKADADAHEVTGIVYEPMTEDTDGNYMTEEEIFKAAHYFMKNAGGVDLQHSFEPLEGAYVAESHVARCEEEIGGQKIAKGTWVMTMDIEDPEIFEKIEKGELTGFSMGGTGMYSEENVELPDVVKQEKKGIIRKLAEWLGLEEPVEKGEVRDRFDRTYAAENLREAWYCLSGALTDIWNPEAQTYGPETDMAKIEEALQDFCGIAREVLSHSGPDSVFKCADGEDMPPVIKAGRKMSAKNIESLRRIHADLGAFLSSFEPESSEEEITVTKEEMELITKTVTEAVQKAMTPAELVEPVEEKTETITKEDVQAMIDEASKANAEEIEKAVAKAMQPFLESAGVPTNLNNEAPVQKEEEHYMHGLL